MAFFVIYAKSDVVQCIPKYTTELSVDCMPFYDIPSSKNTIGKAIDNNQFDSVGTDQTDIAQIIKSLISPYIIW